MGCKLLSIHSLSFADTLSAMLAVAGAGYGPGPVSSDAWNWMCAELHSQPFQRSQKDTLSLPAKSRLGLYIFLQRGRAGFRILTANAFQGQLFVSWSQLSLLTLRTVSCAAWFHNLLPKMQLRAIELCMFEKNRGSAWFWIRSPLSILDHY